MWGFFAEPPEGSRDLNNFWRRLSERPRGIAENVRDSREINGVAEAAKDYLRGDWGVCLAAVYTDLIVAFKVAKGTEEEREFKLLLICDETRTLCKISKTGSGIPFNSRFNDRFADADPDPGTIYRLYSDFHRFTSTTLFTDGIAKVQKEHWAGYWFYLASTKGIRGINFLSTCFWASSRKFSASPVAR